jgi:hypothetical protein
VLPMALSQEAEDSYIFYEQEGGLVIETYNPDDRDISYKNAAEFKALVDVDLE